MEKLFGEAERETQHGQGGGMKENESSKQTTERRVSQPGVQKSNDEYGLGANSKGQSWLSRVRQEQGEVG